MTFRLQREEKRQVASRYADNAVFQLLRVPCRRIEADTRGFRLSPEEVFAACFHYVDLIKESPLEAMTNTECLWEDVFCECREYAANEDAERENLETATGIVLYVLCLCLLVVDSSFYHRIYKKLMAQLNNGRGTLMKRLQELFFASLDTVGAGPLSGFMTDYMASDRFISDEIAGLLHAPGAELMTFDAATLKELNGKVELRDKTDSYDIVCVVDKQKLLTELGKMTSEWEATIRRWKVLFIALDDYHLFPKGCRGFVRGIVRLQLPLNDKEDIKKFANNIRNTQLPEFRKDWDEELLMLYKTVQGIVESCLSRV